MVNQVPHTDSSSKILDMVSIHLRANNTNILLLRARSRRLPTHRQANKASPRTNYLDNKTNTLPHHQVRNILPHSHNRVKGARTKCIKLRHKRIQVTRASRASRASMVSMVSRVRHPVHRGVIRVLGIRDNNSTVMVLRAMGNSNHRLLNKVPMVKVELHTTATELLPRLPGDLKAMD